MSAKNTNSSQTKPSLVPRDQFNVRVTSDDAIHIERLTSALGGTVQDLFRKLIRGAAVPALVIEGESARAILNELRRIGTNVNQIAKRINVGSATGWYTEFEEVRASLRSMEGAILEHLGHS